MMSSLRLRLILGTLACAAAGLLVLSVVTYRQQQSFLNQRINEQVGEAFGPVSHALNPVEEASDGAGERRADHPGAALHAPQRRAARMPRRVPPCLPASSCPPESMART